MIELGWHLYDMATYKPGCPHPCMEGPQSDVVAKSTVMKAGSLTPELVTDMHNKEWGVLAGDRCPAMSCPRHDASRSVESQARNIDYDLGTS